ncbi:polysaccharide biosynthesis tyrosine autokinase [Microbacterium sp. BR1]|uniref:polysaccharide biosynthesis tyrosine autokinase n=1 Tax=Microbacterium sp. BR1 TaxID=1070896 RepID=UPI000C2BD644|nr:polysaccharide biosynthesis tyrosine autokinase [Microbacterium sp. BR1]
MTLRQVLDVLWKRKWTIVAVIAIALVTAVAYLQLRTVSYQSAGIVRLNSAVTQAALAGEIGGISVELDADVVTSAAVLDPAAASLGDTSDELASAVLVEATSDERLVRITVSAQGPTPDVAQSRVQAVLVSYQAYVDAQMASALTSLQDRQQDAIAEVRNIQAQLEAAPGDPIANVNLATELSKMTSATGAIEVLTNAGTSNTTVVAGPYPGELTVPTPLVILSLALLTGLVIGVAIVLIRDQFDDRLRGEDEVEALTGVRSIGELSWDRKLGRLDPPLPVAHNERTDLSERLRTLRSNLAVSLPARGAAFVVTSVEPGDGKSFVSANLALAWARGGKKVILVGGDLRRPNLGRYFGDAADGEGLSDILEEHEDGADLAVGSVESRLNSTRYRRLTILPSGAEPAEPADLFATPILGSLILQLRTLADIVIIDSPPAIGITDAALLAAHTDGAIVLASANRTDRGRLVETIDALRAAGTEVIGVVVNRSRRKLPKSYASYYLADEKDVSRTPSLSPVPSAVGPVSRSEMDDEEAPLRRSRVGTGEATDDGQLDDEFLDESFEDFDDFDDLDDLAAEELSTGDAPEHADAESDLSGSAARGDSAAPSHDPQTPRVRE